MSGHVRRIGEKIQRYQTGKSNKRTVPGQNQRLRQVSRGNFVILSIGSAKSN